jgi:hypothetical protein
VSHLGLPYRATCQMRLVGPVAMAVDRRALYPRLSVVDHRQAQPRPIEDHEEAIVAIIHWARSTVF